MITKIKQQIVLAGLSGILAATGAYATETPKLPEELKEHIIYYNSFSGAGKTDVSTVKISRTVMKGEYDTGKGISGGSYIAQGTNAISFISKDLSLHNNRTASFWFRFDEAIPENASGQFFHNAGKARKWNFINIFFRGGPWNKLQDSALVTQMWDFTDIKGISRIIDRKFRENYPAGKWRLFTITSNGKDISVYINGKAVSIMNASRILNEKDNLNVIDILNGWPVPVRIDDLLFFDVALSEEQIKNYYEATQALLARSGM